MLHSPHERNRQSPQTPDYRVRRSLCRLTRLQQPEAELPQALSRIRDVADANQRQRLLTAMVSLLPTEEVTQMVEKLLEESETLLIDTPYLRRMREKGREEGLQIGREEGQQIGREEGAQIGREEGLREAILEASALESEGDWGHGRACNESERRSVLLLAYKQGHGADEYGGMVWMERLTASASWYNGRAEFSLPDEEETFSPLPDPDPIESQIAEP